MTGAALAVLLAAAAAAGTPADQVASVMSRVDALVTPETGRDARDIDTLDRKASALFAELKPLGWKAAAPLGEAAKAPRRGPKARLFAVMFLTKLRDAAAFQPMTDVLLDETQDADVRLSAAQGLNALDVPPQAARKTFCAALAGPALPRLVEEEVVIALSRLGCDDPAALEKTARALGPRPRGADLTHVRRVVAALGRSRGAAPARSLLSLARWYPVHGQARNAVFKALGERRADLAGPLAPEAYPVVRDALRSESGEPESLLALIAVADGFGPEGDELLIPLASNADAEVVALAADALARRKAIAALPALEEVAAGALNDPRFAPKSGRPDPGVLLARLDDAIAALRRARAAAR